MSARAKRVLMIVVCCGVILGISLWFIPIEYDELRVGYSYRRYYCNIYGHKMYTETVFANWPKDHMSIYERVKWRSDSLGRFHGVVDGQEVVFDSYDELTTAILNDGKDEFGFAFGWSGCYYWDEVEERWVGPNETNERRDVAWLNACKNEFGFSYGQGGLYYWDEVEERWLTPEETNERREAAQARWDEERQKLK